MKNKLSALLIASLVLLVTVLVVNAVRSPLLTKEGTGVVPDGESVSETEVPEGWETYTDAAAKYSISFPKSDGDPSKEVVNLPDAFKDKSRKFSLEVLELRDSRLDPDYCFSSKAVGRGKKKTVSIGGNSFCLTDITDAGAGSVFHTYAYTTEVNGEILLSSFFIRYPTSVQLYAGCEQTADLEKQECKDLAFDETKDTQLFKDILQTLVVN